MERLQLIAEQLKSSIETNHLNNINIRNIVLLVGVIAISKRIYSALNFFYKILLRRSIDLQKRYGKGSWVVITGSSDGIGKQFGMILASKGFNIVLIARNPQKLQNVSKEIQGQHPECQTRIVVANFDNSLDPFFFDKIYEQIKDLDISLLINNVGVDLFTKFEESDENLFLQNIKINTLPVTMLTRKLINKLILRKPKAGILNVASFAGVIPCIYYNVYSATKAYVNVLSEHLKLEFPQLDILIANPLEVSTNMIYNRNPDIITITAYQCAKQTLDDLGHDTETNGHWNHKFQSAFYQLVPFPIYNFIYKKLIAPEFFKERQEGENKRRQQEKK